METALERLDHRSGTMKSAHMSCNTVAVGSAVLAVVVRLGSGRRLCDKKKAACLESQGHITPRPGPARANHTRRVCPAA